MNMYEWADEMNCAVTVCDTQGIILYMNEKACRTFRRARKPDRQESF
mgnify:CR=1 FL=1